MTELEDLERRLSDVINNTCNTIGCDNCGLKWDDGCSATELDSRIVAIELEDERNKAP